MSNGTALPAFRHRAKSPVTLDLKNVTAATALQTALDQCQPSGDPVGFVCVDTFLKISVKRMLDDSSIRVYDVRDLIEYIARQSQKSGSTPAQLALSLANEKSVSDRHLHGASTAEQCIRNLFILEFQQFSQHNPNQTSSQANS